MSLSQSPPAAPRSAGRSLLLSTPPHPQDYAFTFFDPNDSAFQEILYDPQTTIAELFTIVHQWVPQVQYKIDVIGNEILR